MQIQYLRYFYEVAKAQSFTRGAAALRISQPSVSRCVKNLEEAQNVQLFARTKRKVELTEVGKIYFTTCKKVFGELEALNDVGKEVGIDWEGQLRVGASDNLCNYLLPIALEAFEKSYAHASIQLFSGTSSAIKQEILAGRCALGFFYTPVSSKEKAILSSEPIGSVPFAWVVGNRGTAKGIKSYRDLKSHSTFIGSRSSDYDSAYPAMRMHEHLGFLPDRIIETNSQETQKRLVMQGLGYSLLPRHMVTQEIRQGSLRELRPRGRFESPLYRVTSADTGPLIAPYEMLMLALKQALVTHR